MTPRISATLMAVLIVSGICAVAVAAEKVVELTYERPAEYEIPAPRCDCDVGALRRHRGVGRTASAA